MNPSQLRSFESFKNTALDAFDRCQKLCEQIVEDATNGLVRPHTLKALRQLNNELVSSRESLDLIGFLTDAPEPTSEDQG